jgi:tetratricopeptide (TPR) repeat protein
LWLSGRYEESHRLNAESLALFRSLGDDEAVAILLHRLGISSMRFEGDLSRSRELMEESLRIHRELGSLRGESEAIGGLGYVEMEEGNLAEAAELFAQAAEMARGVGFTWWEVGMLAGLSEALIELDRLDEAEEAVRRHLRLARGIDDRQSSLIALVYVAWIARRRGDEERAGLFWGAVEAEEARGPVGQWELERDDYAAKVGIEGERFEQERRRGRRLSFDSAIEEALAG